MIENENATYTWYGVCPMKVYAVYSVPNSPEYRLEKSFKSKEEAKHYIKTQKSINPVSKIIYDIQIEDILE